MRIDRVRFAAAIAEKEITLTELAKKAGVSRVTVSNVKAGRSCTLGTVKAIAAGLGVSERSIVTDNFRFFFGEPKEDIGHDLLTCGGGASDA